MLSARMKQVGDGVITAVKTYVATVTTPMCTRLASLESRVGALTMLIARNDDERAKVSQAEQHFKSLRDLEQQVAALEARLGQLEKK